MKRLVSFSLLSAFLLFHSLATAGPVLRINTSIKPPFSTVDHTGFFDLLLMELGKRIGCEIEVVRLPAARALMYVNEGRSAGEVPRIAGMEKKFPNLMVVKEKVVDYNFVAFGRGPLKISSWGDLNGKRVGYLTGWKIFDTNVPLGADVTRLRKPHLMFEMLREGRLDVVLYERYAGWNILRDLGVDSIMEIQPPLAVRPMYMYMHNSFGHLVPKVSKALADMKSDKTYGKVYEMTLGAFGQNDCSGNTGESGSD